MTAEDKPPPTESPPPASQRRLTRHRQLELKMLRRLGIEPTQDELDMGCPLCRQEHMERAKDPDYDDPDDDDPDDDDPDYDDDSL